MIPSFKIVIRVVQVEGFLRGRCILAIVVCFEDLGAKLLLAHVESVNLLVVVVELRRACLGCPCGVCSKGGPGNVWVISFAWRFGFPNNHFGL
jgi:hypothetical protein